METAELDQRRYAGQLALIADRPWDLVVLTETAYYLGWLYPLFDLGWLAHSLHAVTNTGGRLLLVLLSLFGKNGA